MRLCHDHQKKTASFFFVDPLDRELIPRSLQPTPIRWVPRHASKPFSPLLRASTIPRRKTSSTRPLALSSVTARADGRAGGVRRRRLLARLHLARAPLPLKGRTDGASDSLLLGRPSCLLRWSFFVGVKECAGSPLTGAADTVGARDGGRARPQMSPRSARAGGASRSRGGACAPFRASLLRLAVGRANA